MIKEFTHLAGSLTQIFLFISESEKLLLSRISISLGIAYNYNYPEDDGVEPVVHGHTGDEIEINFENLNCVHKRSEIFSNDAVFWCTEENPILVQCSISDDQAPSENPTDMDNYIGCLDDGGCEAVNGDLDRTSLGRDQAYLEIVRKTINSQEVMGCWQYDREHSREDYKIEMVCCK